MRQLVRFAWLETQCCLFAGLFFAGLGLVQVVPMPLDAADGLLVWCVLVTAVLWWTGWETTREVGVIVVFHAVGIGLELFKVHQGAWAYPRTGIATVAGVPLRFHVRRSRQLRVSGMASFRPADHRLPPVADRCGGGNGLRELLHRACVVGHAGSARRRAA